MFFNQVLPSQNAIKGFYIPEFNSMSLNIEYGTLYDAYFVPYETLVHWTIVSYGTKPKKNLYSGISEFQVVFDKIS